MLACMRTRPATKKNPPTNPQILAAEDDPAMAPGSPIIKRDTTIQVR